MDVQNMSNAKMITNRLQCKITTRSRSGQLSALAMDTLCPVINNLTVGVGVSDARGATLLLNDEALRIHGFASASELLGQLEQYVESFCLSYPDGRPMPLAEWPASRAQRGEFVENYEVLLTRRESQVTRLISYSVVPVYDDDGQLSLLIYNMMDFTEKKQANEEILTLNNRLHHLIVAIKDLASAPNLESVQKILTRASRALTGADGATVIFRDGDCCHYVDEDAIGPLWKGKKFPLHSCISGWVMLHNAVAVIPDIYADDRIPVDAYRATFVKSLAMVPVHTSEAFAAIGNYWSHHYSPSDVDLRLLQTLADAAARAVENIHLLDDLEQQVKQRTRQLRAMTAELSLHEEKKNREIAGALHDQLGPILALAKVRLGQLQKSTTDSSSGDQIQEILSLLTSGIEFTRSLTGDLSPPVLNSLSFCSSLRWLASHFLEQSEIQSSIVEHGHPGCLPDNVCITLFNIVRELFVNIVKHANATRAEAILVWEEERLQLSISDNGTGFAWQDRQRPGAGQVSHGLIRIREQLTYLNGEFAIQARPQNGVRITINVPIGQPNDGSPDQSLLI